GIETAALGDDMFESTIQAGHGPGQEAADLLDDEEIERSIREINEAIRRTAQKRS
ncbi:MAG: serine/threonine-protein phosphatase, partial [Sphaerotilus sulfidivorans]